MSTVDPAKYKPLYLKTAAEYLRKMQRSLNILQKSSSDPEAIDDMYISAHSIKSQSTAMGYIQAESLGSALEFLFLETKEKRIVLTKSILTGVSKATSQLQNDLSAIQKNTAEIDLLPMVQELEHVIDISETYNN